MTFWSDTYNHLAVKTSTHPTGPSPQPLFISHYMITVKWDLLVKPEVDFKCHCWSYCPSRGWELGLFSVNQLGMYHMITDVWVIIVMWFSGLKSSMWFVTQTQQGTGLCDIFIVWSIWLLQYSIQNKSTQRAQTSLTKAAHYPYIARFVVWRVNMVIQIIPKIESLVPFTTLTFSITLHNLFINLCITLLTGRQKEKEKQINKQTNATVKT